MIVFCGYCVKQYEVEVPSSLFLDETKVYDLDHFCSFSCFKLALYFFKVQHSIAIYIKK